MPDDVVRLTVFGLRGSLESVRGYYGMGPTVARLAERLTLLLQAEDPRSQHALVGIPYPAPPTHWNIVTGGLQRAIDAGAKLLVDAIARLAAAEPAGKFVVIGLSQGAASAHVALPQLSQLGNVNGAPVVDRIAAVLLYADPLRLAGDSSNVPQAKVDGALAHVWHVRIATPAKLRGRVLSLCGEEELIDPICAFRPRMRTLLQMYRNRVHTTYDDPERPSGWTGPRFALARILDRG